MTGEEIAAIRERHERDTYSAYGPRVTWQTHADRGALLAEVERLREAAQSANDARLASRRHEKLKNQAKEIGRLLIVERAHERLRNAAAMLADDLGARILDDGDDDILAAVREARVRLKAATPHPVDLTALRAAVHAEDAVLAADSTECQRMTARSAVYDAARALVAAHPTPDLVARAAVIRLLIQVDAGATECGACVHHTEGTPAVSFCRLFGSNLRPGGVRGAECIEAEERAAKGGGADG